jgi:tetratricopeptide (TPR) repeat protein
MDRLLNSVWLTLLLLAPTAAKAEWRAAETRHFTFYSESGDRDLEKLAARLESYDKLMRMATGFTDDAEPIKVRIYEVDGTGEVEQALGLTDSGVAGFYDSNILGPFAVTPRRTIDNDIYFTPALVLHHEYAHHFMLQYFPSIYPPWYVEGFAELIGSSKVLPDGKIGYGMPAKQRGNEIAVNWISVEDLLLKPPHKLRNFDLYGQGWALTHFLTFSKERSPQMRAYLGALQAGRSPEEAAKAFGDLKALDREARRYVGSGAFNYRAVPVEIARPAIKSVRVLSAGEAATIPMVIALRDDELSLYRKAGAREREAKLREANLERMRERARRFAGDPFVLYVLAAAEYTAGHYSASEAAADRLLALQPRHARGMALKSLNMARAASALQGAARTARAAEARSLAGKANRADPDDTLPLLAFYESFHLVGEKPSKEAVDVLAAVVATQPGDTKARQLLVDQLAAEGRWALAIATLLPIANSPHESPRRVAAREQLAKLEAELAKAGGGGSSASE